MSGIYRKEGNIDEAAKLLEQVIEINPDNVDGYALAGIYLLQGKIDASIDLCNKAIKLFPDDIQHYTLILLFRINKKSTMLRQLNIARKQLN